MQHYTSSMPLFDGAAERNQPPVRPVDPAVPPEAVPRLSDQCRAILERLRLGPATNRELAGLALKYTSRVSDLRAAGHDIECYSEEHKTGLAWYRLNEPEGTS